MFQALISFFKTTRETFSRIFLYFISFHFLMLDRTFQQANSKISSKLPTQEFKLQKILYIFRVHTYVSSSFTRNENKAKNGKNESRAKR